MKTSAGGSVAFGGNITDTGKGLLVQNNTGGTVTFNGTTTLNTGANDAVTLTGNTATSIAFNSPNMSVQTTTGHGFVVQTMTGGSVTLGGTINETGGGVLVQNNASGNVAFTGAMILNTGANDAVTLTNNAGATIDLQRIEHGHRHDDGARLRRPPAAAPSAAPGRTTPLPPAPPPASALNLNGVTIDAVNGLNFQSVTTDGAANGIS